MKILWNDKDGGADSRVHCWGIESKGFGSVLLLLFHEGSREAFHTHAFNSVSWLLRGKLDECFYGCDYPTLTHVASWRRIKTFRYTFHMVAGVAPRSWVLSFRGPWVDTWKEFLPRIKKLITLTHGRKVIS